jgi:Cu+-exporting ATPase
MAANPSLKGPVCGMAVTMQSPHVTVQAGTAVNFCGAGCKAKFLASPANYSSSAGIDQSSAPAANLVTAIAIYTCPMHPRIRQIGPGFCPICGMTLEQDTPALDSDEDPELKDFRRRFLWTLPLTVIVALLAMTGHRVQSLNGAMEAALSERAERTVEDTAGGRGALCPRWSG